MTVTDAQPSAAGTQRLKDAIRLFGLPSILLLLILYFSVVTDTFLTAQNISGLLQSAAISAILIMGLT